MCKVSRCEEACYPYILNNTVSLCRSRLRTNRTFEKSLDAVLTDILKIRNEFLVTLHLNPLVPYGHDKK